MAKKTLKNNKTSKKACKDTCSKVEAPCPEKSISFGEAFLDVRTSLLKTVELATERYLGVIQKLQELEKRMDYFENVQAKNAQASIGTKPLGNPLLNLTPLKDDNLPDTFGLNGPKKTETADPMDDI